MLLVMYAISREQSVQKDVYRVRTGLDWDQSEVRRE